VSQVIQGPFAPNEHTGPAEVDPGFRAKMNLEDLECDTYEVSWQYRDEIQINTQGYSYISLSAGHLYELLDFLERSDAKFEKWLKSRKGKAWCKRNGC
jgi:hypothetical protein